MELQGSYIVRHLGQNKRIRARTEVDDRTPGSFCQIGALLSLHLILSCRRRLSYRSPWKGSDRSIGRGKSSCCGTRNLRRRDFRRTRRCSDRRRPSRTRHLDRKRDLSGTGRLSGKRMLDGSRGCDTSGVLACRTWSAARRRVEIGRHCLRNSHHTRHERIDLTAKDFHVHWAIVVSHHIL